MNKTFRLPGLATHLHSSNCHFTYLILSWEYIRWKYAATYFAINACLQCLHAALILQLDRTETVWVSKMETWESVFNKKFDLSFSSYSILLYAKCEHRLSKVIFDKTFTSYYILGPDIKSGRCRNETDKWFSVISMQK